MKAMEYPMNMAKNQKTFQAKYLAFLVENEIDFKQEYLSESIS
jgi:hypothetical protein